MNRLKKILATMFVLFIVITYLDNYSKPYLCTDCNVILISIDTLRADHLSVYGYVRNTSASIDKLANNALLFKNAYAQSSNTLPSHMSIFTSLYPIKHRMVEINKNNTLSNSSKTLTEILKHYGYKTAWFAPLSDPHLDISKGFGRGFDEFYLGVNNLNGWNKVYRWISDNKKEKFFAFLHTSQVHDPYVVPSPFDKLYDTDYEGSIIGEQNKFLERIAKLNRTDYNSIRQFYWQFVNTSDKRDINHLIALYDAQITCCVDPFIGMLMTELQEQGLDNKTVIILTADHGEAFGEHGEFLHITLHKEVLHVPLIIKIPSSDGKVIESQVQSIDIMPSILDILGITIQYDTQGKSLMPLIHNKTKIINEYTYGYWPTMFSVRSDKWKLIKYSNGKLELYDIKTDSEEQVNIVEKYPDVANYMKDKIDEFELSALRAD